MQFDEVVRKRRMVRNYEDRPVDPDVLGRILELATHAPSAGYSQGQRLLVVTDRDTRHAIAALGDEDAYVARGMDPWMSRAPVHVVVCVREEDYHERYREPDKLDASGDEIEWPIPYWWIDAGATMMLILLAAAAEGLGAGFFGVHRLDGLKELLGIPADVAPIGIVTMGHPAPDRRSSSLARGRKPDLVHREHWGSP